MSLTEFVQDNKVLTLAIVVATVGLIYYGIINWGVIDPIVPFDMTVPAWADQTTYSNQVAKLYTNT